MSPNDGLSVGWSNSGTLGRRQFLGWSGLALAAGGWWHALGAQADQLAKRRGARRPRRRGGGGGPKPVRNRGPQAGYGERRRHEGDRHGGARYPDRQLLAAGGPGDE